MMVHSKGNEITDWIFAISKEKICNMFYLQLYGS